MIKFLLQQLIILFVIVGASNPEPHIVGGGTPPPPKTEGSEAVHGSGTGALAPNTTGSYHPR